MCVTVGAVFTMVISYVISLDVWSFVFFICAYIVLAGCFLGVYMGMSIQSAYNFLFVPNMDKSHLE